MPPWPAVLRPSRPSRPSLPIATWRAFTTHSRETVAVACGSEGFVTLDLYNLAEHASSAPLVVHLPPFPSTETSAAQLPDFLQDWPVASINYRWDTAPSTADSKPLRWPMPVHDTAFAFRWIAENLAPADKSRRDIYIYGSHLGASLATSLALTETRAHDRFGVRGFAAYNGIYNWTMFLPDHKINRPKRSSSRMIAPPPSPAQGAQICSLQDHLAPLFGTPSNLFDAFASSSLLFHNPGLLVPTSFHASTTETLMIDALANRDSKPIQLLKPPRKSHLIFPPRKSTLKIPEALLLHDSPPSQSYRQKSTTGAKSGGNANTFETQAIELAELMRRSIDLIELMERRHWDEDIDIWAGESHRRVQVADVGQERKSPELSEAGQDVILNWLRNRIPNKT